MSSLQIGIVGLPNVGKSTLFNALTRNNVLAANYPFATIEPNTGIVPVPDERLEKLAKLYKTEKVIPATVNFVDIAGLVAGASQGEGLGNQFLAHIRETSVIVQVVRAFEDDNITHVADQINPSSDIDTIHTELILADIQTLEAASHKLKKQAKADPDARKQIIVLDEAKKQLDEGKLLSKTELDTDAIKHLNLLTTKPFIYAFNLDEASINDEDKKRELEQVVAPSKCAFICAKLEAELAQMEPAEASELLSDFGLEKSGLENLVHIAYQTLGLQTFLTAGPKEVRAWTIKKGATAPQAAGVIHGDFERGFIAAEIVKYDDLIAEGSMGNARSKGKVRTEGKDYVMHEGDVVEFRFNV